MFIRLVLFVCGCVGMYVAMSGIVDEVSLRACIALMSGYTITSSLVRSS